MTKNDVKTIDKMKSCGLTKVVT